MYEKDALTGVYTRKAFPELADELLAREPEKQFDTVLSVSHRVYDHSGSRLIHVGE